MLHHVRDKSGPTRAICASGNEYQRMMQQACRKYHIHHHSDLDKSGEVTCRLHNRIGRAVRDNHQNRHA